MSIRILSRDFSARILAECPAATGLSADSGYRAAAPALGTTIAASVPLAKTQVHDYVLIDVMAAVVVWLNGTQANDGLALVANSPLNASIDSKENTARAIRRN